jgi:peptidoglycan/LPS O-acetylase OafA/YrhL
MNDARAATVSASPTYTAPSYFPSVDGLRALAVLTVMAFHLDEQLLRGGFVGVDIFFVISGFVITRSISQTRFPSIWALQSHFYARRVARILPALLACLLVTGAAYVWFIPRAWLSESIRDVAVAAFFGVSNIVLALQTDSYFAPRSAFDPFTHTWSLGVEEQFYLLFPFLMYFGGSPEQRVKRLAPIVAVLCVASLIVCALQTMSQWRLAFYMLPARYWELGLGMLLALTLEAWRPKLAARPRAGLALSIAGLALVTLALFFTDTASFPFPWALFPTLGAASLIAVVVARPGDVLARPFGWAPVVFVGRISYSLYLWHWPVDTLMRWTIGLDAWPAKAVAFCAAFALAIPTYFFIENPVRRWRKQHAARPLVFIGAGVAAAVALAFCCTIAFNHKDRLSLSQTRNADIWYPDAWPVRPPHRGCLVTESVRQLGSVEVTSSHPQGCGAVTHPGVLAVAGDSHAWAYARLLREYAYATGREVRVYTLPSCAMVSLQRTELEACKAMESAVADDLGARLGRDDVVFLPSLRVPRYGDQWGNVRDDAARTEMQAFASTPNDPDQLLRRVRASGARIIFEAPTPVFRSPPFRCADWFDAHNPICAGGTVVARTELEARRAAPLAEMHRLEAAVTGVSVWDPFPILCPGQSCSSFRAGEPLFFDGDHLSGAGDDLLLASFTETVERVFAERPALPVKP